MAPVPTLDLASGTKMPIIGLGTWQSSDAAAEEGLNAALEAGYRLIDTAFVYQNEHLVGKVLKEWFDSGKLKREDIFVTTKLPMIGIRRSSVEKFLKKSLSSLGLDYVDLYLAHFPVGLKDLGNDNLFPTDPETGKALLDMDTDLVDMWRGMEEQVDAGRAKAIGVSNFNKEQVEKLVNAARIPVSNNQVELHLYMQLPELVNYCQANKVTVTSYGTLGSPGRKEFFDKIGLPFDEKTIPGVMKEPVVLALAEKYKKTPAQVLLRYFAQKNIAIIPKSVHADRVKQNFEVFDFELTQDEVKTLEDLDKGPKTGRTFRMVDFCIGSEKHPEFPFKEILA